MKQMYELSQQMNLKMNMHMPICSKHKTGNPLPAQPGVFSLFLKVGKFGLRCLHLSAMAVFADQCGKSASKNTRWAEQVLCGLVINGHGIEK